MLCMATLSTHITPSPATSVPGHAPRLSRATIRLVPYSVARLQHPKHPAIVDPWFDSIAPEPSRAQRRAERFGNRIRRIAPDDPAHVLLPGVDSFISRAAALAAAARLARDSEYADRILENGGYWVGVIVGNYTDTGRRPSRLEFLTALFTLSFHRRQRDMCEHSTRMFNVAPGDPRDALPALADMLARAMVIALHATMTARLWVVRREFLDPPPPILDTLTTCVLTAAPPALDTTGVECSPCTP